MLHDIAMDPRQVAALAEWVEPSGAAVMLAASGAYILVGQGDSRAKISPTGRVIEEA